MRFEIAEELVLGLMSVSFDREFVFVRGIVGGGFSNCRGACTWTDEC